MLEETEGIILFFVVWSGLIVGVWMVVACGRRSSHLLCSCFNLRMGKQSERFFLKVEGGRLVTPLSSI